MVAPRLRRFPSLEARNPDIVGNVLAAQDLQTSRLSNRLAVRNQDLRERAFSAQEADVSRERQRQESITNLSLQAVASKDRSAMEALAAIDPERANQLQQFFDQADDKQATQLNERAQQLGRIAGGFLSAPPEQQAQLYPRVRALAAQNRLELPEQFDENAKAALELAFLQTISAEELFKARKPKKENFKAVTLQVGNKQVAGRTNEQTGALEVRTADGFAPAPQGATIVRTPAAQVTIQGPDLTPAAEKAAIELSNQADDLMNQIQEIRQFRELARVTETGATVPITKPIKEVLADVGINVGDEDQIALRQVFEANQNQLALRFRNPESGFGLTGNTSDRDVRFLQSIGGQLSNLPEANEAILTILLAKQRRNALLKQSKAEYMFETGSLKGWRDRRQQIIDDTPLFTEEERAFLEQMAGGRTGTGRIIRFDKEGNRIE